MKIAIMGFGTVGTGVEEILYKKRKSLLKNNFDIGKLTIGDFVELEVELQKIL